MLSACFQKKIIMLFSPGKAGHIYMVRIQKIHYLLSAYHSTRIALDHHIFDTAEKQPVLWESAVLLKASNNVCNLCQSCLQT